LSEKCPPLSPKDREEIKTQLAGQHEWSPLWQVVLDLAPEYASAYANLAAVPAKMGQLDAKTRALIAIAINAATTHLYEPGLRKHCREAIRRGATTAEIIETLQIASVLGVHTMTLGLPTLAGVLKSLRRNREVEGKELSAQQEKMKADWIAARGFWGELQDYMLRLAPDFFEAYVEFSSVPWKTGTLSPKVRELIYVAIDSSTTHLHEAGTRIHMENALRHGAKPSEIVEVLTLVSMLGTDTITFAIPIVLEEIKKVGQSTEEPHA
jgi:alkylhydroperoxidase/carboxymuconolactone decarboxylase family protein YurZ